MGKQTLNSRIASFLKTQKRVNVVVLSFLVETIDHFVEHNDWTPLASLLGGVDPKMQPLLKKITGKVTEGLTLKKDREQKSGLRIEKSHNWGVTEEMPILRLMVEQGQSIYGDAVKSQWFERVENVFDLEKYLLAVSKKLEREGYDLTSEIKTRKHVDKEPKPSLIKSKDKEPTVIVGEMKDPGEMVVDSLKRSEKPIRNPKAKKSFSKS